jgi:hypothetical protein
MPIESLLAEYFSKSKVFLFPALGLKNSEYSDDLKTFIAWEDRYTFNDYRLMVVKNGGRDNAEFIKFEKIYLQTSIYFEEMIFVNADLVAYIFNLQQLKTDWDFFLNAKYSQLSSNLKNRIKNYYGYDSTEWEYIRTYLYPQNYFKLYAEFLYIPSEREKGLMLIQSVGELCNPFDPKREVFTAVPNYLEKAPIILE